MDTTQVNLLLNLHDPDTNSITSLSGTPRPISSVPVKSNDIDDLSTTSSITADTNNFDQDPNFVTPTLNRKSSSSADSTASDATKHTKNSWTTNQTTKKIEALRHQLRNGKLSPQEQNRVTLAALRHSENKLKLDYERRTAALRLEASNLAALQSLPLRNDPLHNPDGSSKQFIPDQQTPRRQSSLEFLFLFLFVNRFTFYKFYYHNN